MESDHRLMQPNDFHAAMVRLGELHPDPREAVALGAGIMWECLNSIGYKDGLEVYEKITRGLTIKK